MHVKLCIFIMYGAAHKSTWHCKGESGSTFCILDRNAYSSMSRVAEEDGSEMLQCDLKTHAELGLATSAELRDTIRRLETFRLTDSANSFAMREKALGFTYEPYNMLSDSSLDNILHLEAQFLHDWMHMIFVTGVWNMVFNVVLEAIRPEIAGNIYTLLYGYIAQWVWPKRVGGMKLHELFTETKRTANAKGRPFQVFGQRGFVPIRCVCAFIRYGRSACWEVCCRDRGSLSPV